MPAALQLMYGTAHTSRATGYQFVGQTPGISARDRELVQTYSSPSGPLTADCNFHLATLVYALPSGRIAVSRMANMGPAFDGRPNSIGTHTAVLEVSDYLAMEGRIAWARELLRPNLSADGDLPTLDVPSAAGLPPVATGALPEWIDQPQLAAEALGALVEQRSLVLVDPIREEDPLTALEVLLWMVPRRLRTGISLCTFDVESNPRRPFRLKILPESATGIPGAEEGVVVLRLQHPESTPSMAGGYARFAVDAVYAADVDPVKSFLRFLHPLEDSPASIDAIHAYWDRLESGPGVESGPMRATWDLDLAEMAIPIAADRARHHLVQAGIDQRANPQPETLSRALYAVGPRIFIGGSDEGLVPTVGSFLEPYATRHDAASLAQALDGAPPGPVGGPAASGTLEATIQLHLEALIAAATDPAAIPADPTARVRLLDGATQHLDPQRQSTPAQRTRLVLAMVGIAPPASRELRRWVAGRLEAEAGRPPAPGTNPDRLLTVSAQVYHDLGDGLAEAQALTRRISGRARSLPAGIGDDLVTEPWSLLGAGPGDPAGSTAPGSPPAGPAASSPPGGPITPPSGTGAPLATPSPPTPPMVRAAREIVTHATTHVGTDLGRVVREFAQTMSASGTPALGLAVLGPLLTIDPTAASPALAAPIVQRAISDALLDLAATARAKSGCRPAQALWTYSRLLSGWTFGKQGGPEALIERLVADLDQLAATEIEAPPLTLWDSATAAALPLYYLGELPPDLADWTKEVRKKDEAPVGAELASIREVLESARARVERIQARLEENPKTKTSKLLGRSLPNSAPKRAQKQIEDMLKTVDGRGG